MITSILPPTGNRPLFIDFDLYTDGDEAFKSELVTLMIENIRELQHSATIAHKQKDGGLFHKTCHKVKPTLSMLNDPILLEYIENIKGNARGNEIEAIAEFHQLCDDIICSLERENSK